MEFFWSEIFISFGKFPVQVETFSCFIIILLFQSAIFPTFQNQPTAAKSFLLFKSISSLFLTDFFSELKARDEK